MFWTYNTTSPQIDIILCKEDLSLLELLDQENVLQELKAQNLKLIEFLIKPDVLRELVSLITTEPNPDLHATEQYKYPNLACELLTSDLPALNERLASEEILNKLYEFLQNKPPLNPLLSSYFSRTLSMLISRKSEQNWFSYQYTCLQTLEFLKTKEDFIGLLLKHMGTSSIMDLTLNLFTLIEGPELKQSLWNWLQTLNVIPNLVDLLGPHSDAECQTNTASLLCNIVQKLRENLLESNEKSLSDPILHSFESTAMIKLLLKTVFGDNILCDTSIQSGVDVLLALIQPSLTGDARCRQALNYTVHDRMDSGLVIASNNDSQDNNGIGRRNNGAKDSENVDRHLSVPFSAMISTILPYIEKFKCILANPPTRPIKFINDGACCPPFGKTRLLIAKLIGVLVSLNLSEMNEEIMRCDIPELLLDLFYAYPSNNFLHTEVEKMIAHAIDNTIECTCGGEREDDGLYFVYLLKKCELPKRLLNIWRENSELESQGDFRRGYMGHVIRIATLIHVQTEKSEIFNELLKKYSPEILDEWNTFVNDSLIAIIKKHSTCLGGIRPKLCQSNNNSFEENVNSNKELKSEFKEFSQDDDRSIIFSNNPSLSEEYAENENFRFCDDLTEDEEERLEWRTKMFDMMCAQKWQSFTKGLDHLNDDDDDDDDEDDGSNLNSSWPNVQIWDSEDENLDEDTNNVSDPWSKLGSVSNPWSANDSSNDEATSNEWNPSSNNVTNWAKFDENFVETFSSASPISDGATATAAAAESQSSFESNENCCSAFKETDMLNSFGDVKISQRNADKTELCNQDLINGEWVKGNEVKSGVGKSNGYIMQQQQQQQRKYSSYDERAAEKDGIFNLESMRGNTLAEKIANAENDLRSQNEEEQHQHQHQCASNELSSRPPIREDFDQVDEQQLSLACDNNFPEYNNNRSHDDDDDDDDEKAATMLPNDNATMPEQQQQITLYSLSSSSSPSSSSSSPSPSPSSLSPPPPPPSPQLDCLTAENSSSDFVTADNITNNTTSDVESSVEFLDVENGLELEEDSITDQSCSSLTDELLVSPIDYSAANGGGGGCRDILAIVDVPIEGDDTSNRCNTFLIREDTSDDRTHAKTKRTMELIAPASSVENDIQINHVVNGEIFEREGESKDCDELVETSWNNSNSSENHVVDTEVSIREPA